jgi:hypothetical protein
MINDDVKPLHTNPDRKITAKAAFELHKGFTAFFLLSLFLLIPVIALALSYLLNWPAAYLLHDLFIPIGSILIAFAALVLVFAAIGAKFSFLRYLSILRSHIVHYIFYSFWLSGRLSPLCLRLI